MTAPQPSNVLAVRALHGVLFIGLVIITAVLTFTVFRIGGPVLSEQPLVGMVFALLGRGFGRGGWRGSGLPNGPRS
jgi:hypothetical protein